jgi:hypothetical protein
MVCFSLILGTDRRILCKLNRQEKIPLTITILNNKIFWIDKDQQDNQMEQLKSRTLDVGLNEPIDYETKWAYEGTRDLEGVQLDRKKGTLGGRQKLLKKYYQGKVFIYNGKTKISRLNSES